VTFDGDAVTVVMTVTVVVIVEVGSTYIKLIQGSHQNLTVNYLNQT